MNAYLNDTASLGEDVVVDLSNIINEFKEEVEPFFTNTL
jgi:hypothetical protein